ncbi:MAG: FAD-binding oxidoreductase [Cyclobacteriaceae bacterium]|nr:FAD-binding oxidoreductase [Cyclobacteriaceae bacterium]
MSITLDYIIVGQGIAGSVLALKLLERNKRIMVYDLPDNNISSSCSAGLFNPLTGRNVVKTWKADILFPILDDFYRGAERMLGEKFYFPLNQYRPFDSNQQANELTNRFEGDEFEGFIKRMCPPHEEQQVVNDVYGGVEIGHSGYVEVNKFIRSVTNFLLKRGSYKEELFDYTALDYRNEIKYKEVKAKYLILCTGSTPGKVPFFNWLPFKFVKGEVLSVQLEKPMVRLLNRGIFVLPLHDGGYKAGSTYDRENLNTLPTEAGKKEITDKMDKLLKTGYTVTGHLAGIRPATDDRRPFVGTHPAHKNIGTLNGLGAKGISLAPYFAGQLIDHLEEGGEIVFEANTHRYNKLYLNS